MLNIITSGESHGKCLIGILENMPEGVKIDYDEINKALLERKGYGRNKRSEIEKEEFKILSGIRENITTGNPIAVQIENLMRDVSSEYPVIPRPGHADLIGSLKYGKTDTRDAIERASARETAMRVILSQIGFSLLKPLGVKNFSFIKRLGEVKVDRDYYSGITEEDLIFAKNSNLSAIKENYEDLFTNEIDRARENGESIGGIIEVIIKNPPVGIGSFVSPDRKLDAKLAQCLMGVQSVKGVSFGRNLFESDIKGSNYQDSPIVRDGILKHFTNNQGGFEAGMTNGEDIVIDVSLKPIPTLLNPLKSIDMISGEERSAIYERSDITQVTSSGIILESVAGFEIAKAFMEEIGGDTLREVIERYEIHRKKFEYN